MYRRLNPVITVLVLLMSSIMVSQAQYRQIIHPEIRSAQPSPVYDFIERYFSEIQTYKDAELLRLRLKDDKVVVVEGSLSSIPSITAETPFSLNRMGDGFYQMSWTNGSRTLLTLRFPVNYELLLGMPKVEIEKKIKEYINDTTLIVGKNDVDDVEYVLQDDGCYQTKPSQFYQIKAFNDTRYYNKVDTSFVPVFDESHNWYSAANLFHGIVEPSQRKLYIEQNMYGGEKSTYTVSLANWLRYCQSNKLKIYFAIEEERVDGLQALLIAHSDEMNYNHMMRLIIPDDFIEKSDCIIKVMFNAFIPTQNVKQLYQKYINRPKKKI